LPVVAILCAAGVAVGLGGCGRPLEDADRRIPTERLRRIDPMRPEEFKKAPAAGGEAGVAAAGAGVVPGARVVGGGEKSAGVAATGDGVTADEPVPAATLLAPESVEISIEQVRAAALKHNLDLAAEVVAPTITRQREDAERAKFEAVFRPSVGLSSINNPSFNSATVNNQQGASVGAGVDIPLRSGGRATIDLGADRTLSGSSLLSTNASWSTAATASIVQPLLRGGGEVATTASIRIAAYQTQIAELSTRLRVISVLSAADRAYWNLYAARRELEVRQQQYELADTQLQQARRRVEAGTAPEIEITRAESGIASRLEAIVIAESNVLLQQRELKRLANMDGLDIATATQIRTMRPPEPVELALDAGKLQAAAVASRDELLQAELQILADAVGIDLARNNLLPQLDASGSLRLAGIDRNLPGATDDVFSTRFKTWRLGINGEIPLGNEAAEARLRESILTRVQRLASKAARELTVRKEVLDATDRIKTSWQRILAARQAAILAGRTLEAEQRQFAAGSRTSTDVLDAAARLADAQSAEIRALADYEIAKVDLAAATGTVLGSASVEWAPTADPKTAEDYVRPKHRIDE
jgi:outer membrane protein TolC